MKILKLKGRSEEAVLEQIKKQYGASAVVLNTQKEEKSGLFGWLTPQKTIITIAVKEEGDEEKKLEEQKEEVEKTLKEEASYEVLLALKDKMDKVEASLAHLKETKEPKELSVKDHTQNRIEAPLAPLKENKLTALIRRKLEVAGMSNQVLDELFKDTQAIEDLEELVGVIYSRIEALFPKGADKEELPHTVFFVGATGVGKTTTIAKLTAKYVLEKHKKVVLFTSDTYRIAAIEQLKTYADILGVPIEIIYDEKELPTYFDKWKEADHIFIDTAGRSHKNQEQMADLKALLQACENKKTILVLAANTSPRDAEKIVATYEQMEKEFDLIVTKLDETDEAGNVINIVYAAKHPVLYLTNGQNVPADIRQLNQEEFIKELLGDRTNE